MLFERTLCRLKRTQAGLEVACSHCITRSIVPSPISAWARSSFCRAPVHNMIAYYNQQSGDMQLSLMPMHKNVRNTLRVEFLSVKVTSRISTVLFSVED